MDSNITTAQQKPSVVRFGHTELFQMRKYLVELVEDLKMKRKGEVEAEKRLEALVDQLHTLQKKRDSEQQMAQKREEELEKSLASIKQQYEEKMTQADVEKRQQQSRSEGKNFVQDKMKEEIRQLSLTTHQQEKQVRELEARLRTEEASAQKAMSRWKEANDKLTHLSQLHQMCNLSLERLEQGVAEAVRVNRGLSWQREHYTSAMQAKSCQLDDLKAQLTKAQAQAAQLPLEAIKTSQAKDRIKTLEGNIVRLEEDNKSLKRDVVAEHEKTKQALVQLETAHTLVNRHLENVKNNRCEADRANERCKDLVAQCGTLTQKLEESQAQLQQSEKERTECTDSWKQKQTKLEKELETHLSSLRVLQSDNANLEELKTKLSEENKTLNEQLEAAKAKLEVDKYDSGLQTGCSLDSLCDNSTETWSDCHNTYTQTDPPCTTHTAYSQTPIPRLQAAAMQTNHQAGLRVCSTQTSNPVMVHASAGLSAREVAGLSNDQSSQTTFSTMENATQNGNQGKACHTSVNTSFSTNNQKENKNIERNGYSQDKLLNTKNQKVGQETSVLIPRGSLRSTSVELENNKVLNLPVANMSNVNTPQSSNTVALPQRTTSLDSIWQNMTPSQSDTNIARDEEEALSPEIGQYQTQELNPAPHLVKRELDATPQKPLIRTDFMGVLRATSKQNPEDATNSNENSNTFNTEKSSSEELYKSTTGNFRSKSKPVGMDEAFQQGQSCPSSEHIQMYESDLTYMDRSRWGVHSRGGAAQHGSSHHNMTTSGARSVAGPEAKDLRSNEYKDRERMTLSRNSNTQPSSSNSMETSRKRVFTNLPLSKESTQSTFVSYRYPQEVQIKQEPDDCGSGQFRASSSDQPSTVPTSNSLNNTNKDFHQHCETNSLGRFNNSMDVKEQLEEDSTAANSSRKVFNSLRLAKSSKVDTTGSKQELSLSSSKPGPESTFEENSLSLENKSYHKEHFELNKNGVAEQRQKIIQNLEQQKQRLQQQHKLWDQQENVSEKSRKMHESQTVLGPKKTEVNSNTNSSEGYNLVGTNSEATIKEMIPNSVRDTSITLEVESSLTATTSTTANSRNIFKSSISRPSLQENISAFTASSSSRQLLGAPPPYPKGHAGKSRAHSSNPRDKGSDKSQLNKESDATLRNQADLGRKVRKPSRSKQQRQQQKKWSPLFPPNISKLSNYGSNSNNDASSPSAATKGILKEPRQQNLIKKNVHFAEHLEVHMKGLTQESQQCEVNTPSPGYQPLSRLFQVNPVSPSSTVKLPELDPLATVEAKSASLAVNEEKKIRSPFLSTENISKVDPISPSVSTVNEERNAVVSGSKETGDIKSNKLNPANVLKGKNSTGAQNSNSSTDDYSLYKDHGMEFNSNDIGEKQQYFTSKPSCSVPSEEKGQCIDRSAYTDLSIKSLSYNRPTDESSSFMNNERDIAKTVIPNTEENRLQQFIPNDTTKDTQNTNSENEGNPISHINKIEEDPNLRDHRNNFDLTNHHLTHHTGIDDLKKSTEKIEKQKNDFSSDKENIKISQVKPMASKETRPSLSEQSPNATQVLTHNLAASRSKNVEFSTNKQGKLARYENLSVRNNSRMLEKGDASSITVVPETPKLNIGAESLSEEDTQTTEKIDCKGDNLQALASPDTKKRRLMFQTEM